MGRKFNWKSLSFEQVPEQSSAQFGSSYPLPDGFPVRADDPRFAMLFGHGRVSRETAKSIPAVARGLSMLTSLANLPLVTFRGGNEVVVNKLLSQIDPELPNVVTLAGTIEDLVFEGHAYWQILLVNRSTGYPVKARYIAAYRVTETEGEYWIDGHKVDDPDSIIKFYSPRQPLLPAISQSVRRAVALANTSEMYAKNPMPKLMFSPKADVDIDPAKATAAIEQFADNRNDSPYSYVGAALDAKPLDLLSPAEIQLIEQDKAVMLAIANFFDMDPEEVGVSTTSRTYKNAVERRIDRRNDQLSWVALAVEQRLSLGDVTPAGYFVKFDFDEFFRADPLTRSQIGEIEYRNGFITVDEYRQSKGLPPLTPEQRAELNPRPVAAVQASFSSDDETTFGFESAEFSSVDAGTRTVKVLAVPYGEVARKNGRKFIFQKGSIKWPTPMKKVKLLRDHDYTQSVGYATEIEDTDKGLVVTFKVSTGPEGDRALAGFSEGNFDAASIGVDFEEDSFYKDKAHPGVYMVQKAYLKEISQVSIPAFENAGLISVQAAADKEGANMPENTNGAVETASEKSYTISELKALGLFAKDNEKPVKAPASVQDDENVAPRELKANAQEKAVAVTSVKEPGPYRFGRGATNAQFDLSTDLVLAGRQNDAEAKKRVVGFMQEDFAVATTDVDELNPTIQRPDLYVGNLDYSTPIWNRINKGAPPNGVNPFAFPKFATGTTLVADHTEGTEPTLGAFTTTGQTVTPTALSGKLEINREVWDQGGNPAVSSIIRAEMHRAYREGLETAAATFLDAESFTTVTLTAGEDDEALVTELESALVALQAVRGGYRMNEFVVHVDLYKELVLAKDTTGRRLYPALGATNANGVLGTNYGRLDLNGLTAEMAWALGATGAVIEKSYLFNAEDVHGWATAPQDLTFDIQVKSIYVGLFGYKAFAVSRAAGVRTIAYDPVA